MGGRGYILLRVGAATLLDTDFVRLIVVLAFFFFWLLLLRFYLIWWVDLPPSPPPLVFEWGIGGKVLLGFALKVLIIPAVIEFHSRALVVASVEPEFEVVPLLMIGELEGKYAVVVHRAFILEFVFPIHLEPHLFPIPLLPGFYLTLKILCWHGICRNAFEVLLSLYL